MPDSRKYADRAEYLKKAVTLKRQKVRRMLVEYMGGRCLLCGYNACIDALDLHHKYASQKSFGISSSGLTRSWEKNKTEADKCVLLCVNCHREIHAGYKQPIWETK